MRGQALLKLFDLLASRPPDQSACLWWCVCRVSVARADSFRSGDTNGPTSKQGACVNVSRLTNDVKYIFKVRRHPNSNPTSHPGLHLHSHPLQLLPTHLCSRLLARQQSEEHPRGAWGRLSAPDFNPNYTPRFTSTAILPPDECLRLVADHQRRYAHPQGAWGRVSAPNLTSNFTPNFTPMPTG